MSANKDEDARMQRISAEAEAEAERIVDALHGPRYDAADTLILLVKFARQFLFRLAIVTPFCVVFHVLLREVAAINVTERTILVAAMVFLGYIAASLLHRRMKR